MYSKIKVSPEKPFGYKLLEDFSYKDITVPKGYITNGADIPRIFWSFIPPYSPELLPAIVVHDFLCDLELYEKADLYFKEALIELEISPIKVFTLYGGVNLFTLIIRPIRESLICLIQSGR